MAKLSGDDNSWKAEGLRAKNEDWEARERPPKPAKKNKKKWCKGKKGVEHKYEPYEKSFGSRTKYGIMKCTKCHKEDWSNWVWSNRFG